MTICLLVLRNRPLNDLTVQPSFLFMGNEGNG